MAGIVGLVRSGGDHPPSNLNEALSLLCHNEHFSGRLITNGAGLSLGVVFREAASQDVFSDNGRGITVVSYGNPLKPSRGGIPVSAQTIAEGYLEKGVGSIFQLDGSFAIAVVDDQQERIWVLNDRTGTLPVAYATSPGRCAFAPEAKALFPMLGLAPCLDQEALLAFVNCGYPIGCSTMFESVRLMEPAHCLEIDMRDASLNVHRYWDIRFAPNRRQKARDAAVMLREALAEAHRAALADSPERVQILLTGGLDSRAMLGTLADLGQPPDEAVTWGVSDTIPNSDPEIARKIAQSCGVPFTFLRYGAETFVENSPGWTYVSELMSDNMGNFAAGAGFLYREMNPAPVVLIGDQMFGPGGFPLDREDAVESITKVPGGGLLPAFSRIIKHSYQEDLSRLFRAQIGRVIAASSSDEPKDIQDYLYFHLYVFRWLYAPGYFKEPMVTARRPMMHNRLLDFVASMPSHLRVDKTTMVRMMRSSSPRLMRFPKSTANSLVDWNFEIRREGKLRDSLLEVLRYERIKATPLGPLVDRKAYEELTAAYFSTKPIAMRRRPSVAARVYDLRRRLSVTPATGRMAKRLERVAKFAVGGRGASDGVAPVVRRLALISMMQQMVDEGQFAGNRTGADVTVRRGDPGCP